jgi:hypothetical protein
MMILTFVPSTDWNLMATVTSKIDDLDGSEATETIVYSIDGLFYAIDLSSINARSLRDVLQPYVEASRQVSAKDALKQSSSGAVAAEPISYDSAAVRQWAAENGVEVSPRGRLSETVLKQYHAAQS